MANFEAKISDVPTPRWWVGEFGREPVVCVSLPTDVVNLAEMQVELVSAHLEGTEGIRFPLSFKVSPSHKGTLYIGARMRPMIAEEGKILSGQVNFLDSHGTVYRAGSVAFEPPPMSVVTANPSNGCVFCVQPITAKDCYYTLNGVAHRTCIWR